MLTVLAVATAFSAACGGSDGSGLPQGDEHVETDPSEFTAEIDNPWMPLRVGARWAYRETDRQGGEQRVEVTVLDETREVMGVEVRVVHDVVTEDGELVEDTYDWYAQDAEGNVWYFDGAQRDAGEAEDTAAVLSLDERVEVPFGSYEAVLMTKESTPLEPDVLEHKFYARGVGLVLALAISGGTDREELVEHASP